MVFFHFFFLHLSFVRSFCSFILCFAIRYFAHILFGFLFFNSLLLHGVSYTLARYIWVNGRKGKQYANYTNVVCCLSSRIIIIAHTAHCSFGPCYSFVCFVLIWYFKLFGIAVFTPTTTTIYNNSFRLIVLAFSFFHPFLFCCCFFFFRYYYC